MVYYRSSNGSNEYAAIKIVTKDGPYLDDIDVVVGYCAINAYFIIRLCRGRRSNCSGGGVAL